jgi:hypothetical protein
MRALTRASPSGRLGTGAADGDELAARALGLAETPSLPSRAELSALVKAAKAALESEASSLRPRDSYGLPGGMLELPALPTVLVPDIHARPRFIASILRWAPEGESLARLLATGRACLVCLGDLFHSEAGNAPRRWAAAYREYASRWATRASMDEEMGLALAAARIVLEAKVAFPSTFHYIKGNHDNIADEEGRGDHPFCKFAAEGEMVASWFRATYGEGLLASYRGLELDLPVLALGPHFAASHGEPAFALTRDDAIEYRSRPDVVEALIWTANGEAEAFSVARSLDALLGPERAKGALWFAGHRPVDGRYALRAGGKFVQFHDPRAARVAWLLPGRDPDPERDIIDIQLAAMPLPRASFGPIA